MQVIRAMPPSRLAGAILASDSNASSGDGQDVAVVERLEWVRQFARDTASADADPECRMLGAACSGLQVCFTKAPSRPVISVAPFPRQAVTTMVWCIWRTCSGIQVSSHKTPQQACHWV